MKCRQPCRQQAMHPQLLALSAWLPATHILAKKGAAGGGAGGAVELNFILARSTNHRKRRLDGWRKRDGAMLPGILNEAAPTKLPALGSLLKVRVPYPCPSFHSQYPFLTLSPFFIPIFLLYFFFFCLKNS